MCTERSSLRKCKTVHAHRQHAAHGSLFSAAHWATGQCLEEGFSWRSQSQRPGPGAAGWLGGGRGRGTAQWAPPHRGEAAGGASGRAAHGPLGATRPAGERAGSRGPREDEGGRAVLRAALPRAASSGRRRRPPGCPETAWPRLASRDRPPRPSPRLRGLPLSQFLLEPGPAQRAVAER